jgi:hypothetical protein
MEKFTRPASISFVPVDRKTGLKASVESHCQPIILEAFLRGTEPTMQCSEEEHFKVSLPYYLQRFQFTRRQELRADADGLRRLLQQGAGEISLSEGGKSLVLREAGGERVIPLDISRRDLRELLEDLKGGMSPQDAPEASPGTGSPRRVGKDGRDATLILIKYD